ncbi:hypothetical protein Vsou_05590 [Vulcanisaeta souniana JCM 11219]|uniref:Uncharacterized protein n=1 Tax=Vulcanisaeta souniana JCM 11219 TaxID=1293586 RepID=A0ABM8BKI4_9CREN|nr:hypothetical protein Vsou_05590 [Vulcanisaeta souniana JCM 11219]
MDETKNSARLYVAMRNAARELGVNVMAVDYIALYNIGL